MIPLFLIKNDLGKNFVFHSNLSIKQKAVKKLPKFYQEILTRRWRKYFSSPQKVSTVFASQYTWYNEYIKIDNNTKYFCYFPQKNLNHISDLFEDNGKMRSW